MAGRIMLAKMLHARAIDSDTLLSSPTKIVLRRGPSLLQRSDWHCREQPNGELPEENPARSVLEPRVRAANGDVHSTLSLEEPSWLPVRSSPTRGVRLWPILCRMVSTTSGEAYTEEGSSLSPHT